MTDSSATVETEVGHDDPHVAHLEHGLSEKGYWGIAGILGVITAVEVAWSYLPAFEDAEGMTSVLEVGGLLFMMAIKFVTVAAYFMHLKFDKPLLTKVFYSGLILAIGVYVATLATFEVFG